MEERIKFHVGLDVHKDSISVAAAEPGRGREDLAPFAERLVGCDDHGASFIARTVHLETPRTFPPDPR
jgi:hypothetical protein